MSFSTTSNETESSVLTDKLIRKAQIRGARVSVARLPFSQVETKR